MRMKQGLRAIGLPQAALAKRVGVSESAVSRWVNGRCRIPAERVPEVSRITGLPKHELRPDLFDPPAPAPQPQPAAANDPAEAA